MNATRAVFRIVGALAIAAGAALYVGDTPEGIGLVAFGAALLFVGFMLRGGS